MTTKKTIDELTYHDYCNNNYGFCTNCVEFTREGGTEPDAEGYECPDCENNSCMGIEQALMMDLFEIQ